MSADELDDLVASIARSFESDVKAQHARITVLEGKIKHLEARISAIECAHRGTARSREFVESFQSLVAPADVTGLHSESRDADGVVTRLYDLKSGRTGIEVIHPGESAGPIRYAD